MEKIDYKAIVDKAIGKKPNLVKPLDKDNAKFAKDYLEAMRKVFENYIPNRTSHAKQDTK